MKVLVSDPLSPEGIALLEQHYRVDHITGLSEAQLIDVIGDYHALVVRSGTRVLSLIHI